MLTKDERYVMVEVRETLWAIPEHIYKNYPTIKTDQDYQDMLAETHNSVIITLCGDQAYPRLEERYNNE